MQQRRDLLDEVEFFTSDVGELSNLRDRVIELGESEATANGLIGWLVAKQARQDGGERRFQAKGTNARYRRILRELSDGAPTGDRPTLEVVAGGAAPAQRRRRRAERGAASTAVAMAGASVSTGALVAVVTGSPLAGLAAGASAHLTERGEPAPSVLSTCDELARAA